MKRNDRQYFVRVAFIAIVLISISSCLAKNNKQSDSQLDSTTVANQNNNNSQTQITIVSDTIVSSGANSEFLIPDNTLLKQTNLSKENVIKNIDKLTLGASEPLLCYLPDFNNYKIILSTIEGENGDNTSIGTIKGNSVVDVLYIEGTDSEPGNEDKYTQITRFAILKNYQIILHKELTQNGKTTKTEKKYTINNDGKFCEIK